MRTTISKAALWAPTLLLLVAVSPAAEPVYPVKVSENARVQSFSTPDDWEDALLILEPAGG